MYPLIQTHVWAKIGGEHGLLKMVLDSFIKVCVCVCREGGEGGREVGRYVKGKGRGTPPLHPPTQHPHTQHPHTHTTHTHRWV